MWMDISTSFPQKRAIVYQNVIFSCSPSNLFRLCLNILEQEGVERCEELKHPHFAGALQNAPQAHHWAKLCLQDNWCAWEVRNIQKDRGIIADFIERESEKLPVIQKLVMLFANFCCNPSSGNRDSISLFYQQAGDWRADPRMWGLFVDRRAICWWFAESFSSSARSGNFGQQSARYTLFLFVTTHANRIPQCWVLKKRLT